MILCVLFNLSVPQCPHLESRDDKKDMLLVRVNEDDAHKELSTSLAYTKCSIRALSNNSWSRVSLARTQQELSKKKTMYLIHSRASYNIKKVWPRQGRVPVEREPYRNW